MPFFSVVIPLYNKANWIAATIESVLAQSFRDFELLVVNNGSTDGGEKIVETFSDARIQLIHQDNGGVSFARNVGIKTAQAPYIAFLDADDLWSTAFLEQIKTLITLYPSATAYGCQYAFRQGLIDLPPHHPLLSSDNKQIITNYFDQVAVGDMLLTASSVCVPKTLFERVGMFPEGERIGEDQDMWARLAFVGSIAFHGNCAAYYRQNISGMATKAKPDTTLWPFVDRLLRKVRSGELPTSIEVGVKKYAIKQLLGQASQLVLAGEQAAARQLFAVPEARYGGKRYWYWKTMNQLPAFLRDIILKRHG